MKNYDTLASILDFLNKLEEAIRNYDDSFISKNRMFSILNREFSVTVNNSNRYSEDYSITSLITNNQKTYIRNLVVGEILIELDPELKPLLSSLYEEFNAIPVIYSDETRRQTTNNIVTYREKEVTTSLIEKKIKVYEEYNLSLYTNEYGHYIVFDVRDPRSGFEVDTSIRRCTYLLKNQVIKGCKIFSSDGKKFVISDPRGFKVALGEIESKKVEMILLFTGKKLEELEICWAFINNGAKLVFPDFENNLEFINAKFMISDEKREQIKSIDYFLRSILITSTSSLKGLAILGETITDEYIILNTDENKIDVYTKDELNEIFQDEFLDYQKGYLPELKVLDIVTRGYFDRLLKRRN